MTKVTKVKKSDENWREELSPEAFEVTRQAATEAPFSGRYWDTKTDGVYHCVCCGEALFDSQTKYDSGSGWPSFHSPIDVDAVETREDRSQFMVRTEVACAKCEAHLGHVFPDGPEPTGLRFCLNSLALDLSERGREEKAQANQDQSASSSSASSASNEAESSDGS